jgi:hypothetical protein
MGIIIPGSSGRKPSRHPGAENGISYRELIKLWTLITQIEDEVGKIKEKEKRRLITEKTEKIRSSFDEEKQLPWKQFIALRDTLASNWETLIKSQNDKAFDEVIRVVDSIIDLVD